MALLRQLAMRIDRRRRMIAIILVGWVALVVTGSGQKSDSSGQFALPGLQDILLAALGLLALCGLILLPLMFRMEERHIEAKPMQRIRSLIVVTVLVVLVAFAVGPQDFEQEPEEEVPIAGAVVVTPEESTPDGSPDNSDALIPLLLVCLGAGALLMWSRRKLAAALGDSGSTPDMLLEAEVGPAIDMAAEQLLRGDDPRMSVLAAYAGLERSLAEQGRGRNPHETPTEHLARVLASLPIILGPAIRLGELYEVARFSDHAITRADQQQAALALDQSRHKLAEQPGAAR